MRTLRQLPLLAAFAIVALSAGSAWAEAKFLGNASCEKCHKEIFDSWKKSIHAKAFDLLAPNTRADKKKEAGLKPAEDYRKDKSCMNCHVMGWDGGGYSFDKPADEWKGVGCEVCHGAAERYLELHDKKDLAKRDKKLKQAGLTKPLESSGPGTCATCHYSFDNPYSKIRDKNRERNWADPKWRETYHVAPKK